MINLDAYSLDKARDRCLSLHSGDLPEGVIDLLFEPSTPFEKITETAEILYANRADLSEPWLEYMLALWQFCSVNQFAVGVDGRERAPAIVAAITDPQAAQPAPVEKYVMEAAPNPPEGE